MNKTEIQNLLQALRGEIDKARIGDEQERARLTAMIAELERQLLTADAAPPQAAEGLVDGLKTAVEQFELEHPRVGALLNQLVLALSAMGI